MYAISEATFPNGHKSSRVFRWKGASGDLINVLAKTVANGGAFTVRPATPDEVATSEARRIGCAPRLVQATGCVSSVVDVLGTVGAMGGDYTFPIVAIYGDHTGLNADWSSRAWCFGPDHWILDDENKEQTVSVVRRNMWGPREGEIDTLFSGPVPEALAFVRELVIVGPEVAA